jgi:hypothetical protein
MVRKGWLGWGIVVVIAALSGPALADPTAEDKAAAESLFQDALKLIGNNKYAEACPKLEASNKLDPAVGTLFNLGDCYEHTGRTASAWSSFGEARRFAERLKDARSTDAAEREKALEPRLARLVVQISEKADGLVVLRDKKPVDAALIGSAVPVDPGKHTVEAQAPGREPWSTTVDVPDQPGTVTTVVPPLAAARTPGGGEPPQGTTSGLGGRKIAGIVLGSTGLASLIAGGVFGGLALAKTSDSDAHCVQGTPDRCDPDGLAMRRDADVLATVANITLGAGGALVAGGVVLYLTAPSVAAQRPAARPGPGPTPAGSPAAGRRPQIRLAPVVGAFTGVLVSGSY